MTKKGAKGAKIFFDFDHFSKKTHGKICLSNLKKYSSFVLDDVEVSRDLLGNKASRAANRN